MGLCCTVCVVTRSVLVLHQMQMWLECVLDVLGWWEQPQRVTIARMLRQTQMFLPGVATTTTTGHHYSNWNFMMSTALKQNPCGEKCCIAPKISGIPVSWKTPLGLNWLGVPFDFNGEIATLVSTMSFSGRMNLENTKTLKTKNVLKNPPGVKLIRLPMGLHWKTAMG